MEPTDLEGEVSRLKVEVAARKQQEVAITGRIAEVNEHHTRLLHTLDDLSDEIRAMKKSLRWLLAKARGEEESI